MKVVYAVVDELPESCRWCQFGDRSMWSPLVEIRRWQYLSKQDEREIENLKYAREVFKEFRRSQK